MNKKWFALLEISIYIWFFALIWWLMVSIIANFFSISKLSENTQEIAKNINDIKKVIYANWYYWWELSTMTWTNLTWSNEIVIQKNDEYIQYKCNEDWKLIISKISDDENTFEDKYEYNINCLQINSKSKYDWYFIEIFVESLNKTHNLYYFIKK